MDSIKEVRGQRRSGGISFYFPQIHRGSSELQSLFESAANANFGMIMPKTAGGDGSDFAQGMVSMGFPFLRPSRNRCDLYACYAGLKMILDLLKHGGNYRNGAMGLNDVTFHLDVCTDSGYAWKLLQDIDELSDLGSLRTLDDFCDAYVKIKKRDMSDDDVNNKAALSFVNPDILYALCINLRKLVDGKVADADGNIISVGCSNSIRFMHSGEMLGQNSGLDFSSQMMFFSKRAAMWQFSVAKTL